MKKKLVIVESPAKVKTIKKYLGSGYDVMASKGHVRDLPKSSMGIDTENDYEPKYITIRGKGDLISELKKKTKEADKVYLATDPDREGEAISWHLAKLLNLEPEKQARITFNEITKEAITASIKNPRDIDMKLVDAQQARRVLDRLVGYSISPILWEKVKKGLSAGRVQSVALRMVCDRDMQIEAFNPEEYWEIVADVTVKGSRKPIPAKFYGDKDGKIALDSKEKTDKILKALSDKEMHIKEIKQSERIKKAPYPFVTSTMQQDANRLLNFTTKKTMSVAQSLYENGLITYLRTDSIRTADEAIAKAKGFIAEHYGKDYVSHVINKDKKKNNVQDAHEAIRPTDINRTPESVKESLDKDSFKLYQLIWKRFVASRMTNAIYDVTSVDFENGGYIFKATDSSLKFDGYMSIYTGNEEKPEKNAAVANLTKDSKISAVKYNSSNHFTQPPAHYTEATLVRALEEQGIGRPSTYSPTIAVILERHYVNKEKKNLVSTELGRVVNEIMMTAFPSIVNPGFTAEIEEKLDEVEEGDMYWKEIIRDFYPGLEESVKEAKAKLGKFKVKDEETDVICEKCGRNMVIKFGPHGKFLACPGFPECRNTKPLLIKAGVKCPKCGKDLIVRRTKKGRAYYSCEGYPECDYMSWTKPNAEKKNDK